MAALPGGELGLRNYWYPVTWSRRSRAARSASSSSASRSCSSERRPGLRARTTGARTAALRSRLGRQDFPGTWTCPYHGWTYQLDTGLLFAAITDGPDSPICGKVAVRDLSGRGAARARVGLAATASRRRRSSRTSPRSSWATGVIVGGRISRARSGNWRFGAENGFDEGHAKSSTATRSGSSSARCPCGARRASSARTTAAGSRAARTEVHEDADFPGLGTWPPHRSWRRLARAPPQHAVEVTRAALRLPGWSRCGCPTSSASPTRLHPLRVVRSPRTPGTISTSS